MVPPPPPPPPPRPPPPASRGWSAQTTWTKKEKAKPKRAAKKATVSYSSSYLGVQPKFPREMKVGRDSAMFYMSPFGKEVPPINPNSLGHFTCATLLARANLTTSTTQSIVLVFAPSARSIYQASAWNVATGVRDPTLSSASAPTYRFQSADTPIGYRPLRAGLRLRNTTPAQNQGGAVRILQQSAPIEFAWASVASPPVNVDLTPAMVAELADATSSNPNAMEYTGVDLATGLNEVVLAAATMSEYNSYGGQFANVSGNVQFQAAFDGLRSDMPMNTAVIVFEPTATAQTYSLSFCIQAALRYPSNTLLGDLAKTPGNPTPRHVEYINNVHETMGRSQGLLERRPSRESAWSGIE